MTTVLTEEGYELNFVLNKDDKHIEMDEQTRDYLLDATSFLFKSDFAFLQNTKRFILWYNDYDSHQLLQIEEALKVRDL